MLPTPPKLKLTPRLRGFLAGEHYPPDEPYEQPPLGEETRQRNLKGVADARAALHAKKPYKEGTEGQDFHKFDKNLRRSRAEQRVADEEASLAEEEMRDFETGRHRPDRRPRAGYRMDGAHDVVEPFDEEEQKLLAESTEEDAVVWRSGNATPDLVTIEGLEDLEWEEVKEAKPLYDEGVAGQWFYNVAPSPVDYFREGTHGMWADVHVGFQNAEDRTTNPDKYLHSLQQGLGRGRLFDPQDEDELGFLTKQHTRRLASPNPKVRQEAEHSRDYYEEGTHGQIYGDYGTSGFAQPAVATPKQAGPPPPGATSSRPVEDKPPTLSNRSYFSSGTQGQDYHNRDRSKRDRSGEAEKRRERRRKHGDGRPRTDKTTPFDTMTREELMRHREEEAQRVRDEK